MSHHKYQRFSDRFFEVSPLYTIPGWYARVREGKTIGPFPSKGDAHRALCEIFGLATDADEAEMSSQQYAPDCRG